MVRRYLYRSCFCCCFCCCLCSNEICIKHKRDFFPTLNKKKTFLCLFKITLLGHVVPGAQMSLQRPTNIARPSAQERLLLLSSFFFLLDNTQKTFLSPFAPVQGSSDHVFLAAGTDLPLSGCWHSTAQQEGKGHSHGTHAHPKKILFHENQYKYSSLHTRSEITAQLFSLNNLHRPESALPASKRSCQTWMLRASENPTNFPRNQLIA